MPNFKGYSVDNPFDLSFIYKSSLNFVYFQLCQDILTSRDPTKVCSVQDQQNFFLVHVCSGIKRFLKDVYLCTILPGDTPQEFKIFLDFDTVNGRKKINFKDEATLASDVKISTMMREKKIPLDLDAVVTITSKDEGKTVDIEMTDSVNRKKSALPNFGTYFAVNIQAALKYYLKEAWDSEQLKTL